jgi:hypothetical protein
LRYIRAVASLVFLVLVVTACTSPKRTGVLDSYDSLYPVAKDKRHFFNKSRDANLSAYTNILVPPIKVLSLLPENTPQQIKLNNQISAYATAAYRKLIMKHSSNYQLVDVGQKNTLVMNIFISLVKVSPEDEGLKSVSSIPFAAIQMDEVHLLIEVRTTDAMSGKTLTRSMQVIEDQTIVAISDVLEFKDFQKALDSWLEGVIVKQ